MNSELHHAADAALARGQISEAIRIFETALADTPADYSGWMKLAALRRKTGHATLALDAVNAALTVRSNDFIALLMKGNLHEALGETGRAAELYRAVLFHADQEEHLPPPLTAQIERIRSFLADYRTRIDAHFDLRAECDELHTARARRLADNVLDRRPVFHQEPTHYRYPGLPEIEFFDFAYTELQTRLRSAFFDILSEFEALFFAHADQQRPYVDFAPGQPLGQWSALNRSPDWNALHLLRYGEAHPINATACPKTLAAFAGDEQASIPGLGPNLMFSLLAPHTHIPPHHGVANFRTVCHLPLIVPSDCRFRVGADTRTWISGQPWVFDDTIEHEAWNDSDTLRVVLIGDLWRPELDPQDRAIICKFIQALDTGTIGAL